MAESLLQSAGIQAQELLATEFGRGLLLGELPPDDPNRELPGVLRRFAESPDSFDEIFEPYDQIGNGTMSQVYRVGTFAVKVSVPDTIIGRITEERPLEPEHLITQMQLMNALRHHLAKKTSGSMTAPQYELALHVDDRHGLAVLEYMAGWADMSEWSDVIGLRGLLKQHAIAIIDERIMEAVEDTPFENAIDDLFIDDSGFNAQGEFYGGMRDDNILLEPGTRFEGLAKAKLCLIDQPPPFAWHKEAARVAIDNYSPSDFQPRYMR